MAFSPADFWPPGPPVAGPAVDQVARDAAAAAQSTANAAVSTGPEQAALLSTPESRAVLADQSRLRGYDSVANPAYAGGAKGDGSSDDTAAFVAAAARGGHLRVPYTGNAYKVGPVVFNKPTVLDFEAGAFISPLFDTTTAQTLLKFQQPNSGLLRPRIVGAGPVTVSASKSLIYATAAAKGFTVDEPDISNCKWSDGTRGQGNLTRTNPIYLLCDDARVTGGKIDEIHGPGIFAATLSGLRIRGVKFHNCYWYNINLDEDLSDFDIDGCVFKSDEPLGVYWGGAVNIMSQPTSPTPAVVRDGSIRGCKFDGLILSYGACVRIQSAFRITVENNHFNNITAGSLSAGGNIQYVAVDWRFAPGTPGVDNGPWSTIKVLNNTMVAGPGVHRGVYAKCSQVGTTRNVSRFLTVRGNTFESPDPTRTFDSVCGLHGMQGGMDHVDISDNIATVMTAAGTPVPGAIGVVSTDAQGSVNHLMIDGNRLEDIGTLDPTSAVQLAVYVQGWADQVTVGPRNRAKNFLRALRTTTNVTNLSGADGFVGEACRYENLLSVIPGDGPIGIRRSDTKPAAGLFLDGDFIYKRNQSPSTSPGWVCTTAGGAATGVYANAATYAAGLWIAGGTGKVYELLTAGGGTTSVEPVHTVGDVTGADGYAWRYRAATTAVLSLLATNAP